MNNIRQMLKEYAFNSSPFSEDDVKVARLKFIISKLSQVDRTIIILYADCLSTRKLGKKMGMSHTTIRREISRIREQIIKEYQK